MSFKDYWKRPGKRGRKQIALRASVPLIAAEWAPYIGHTMDIKLKPFDFAQAATRAGMPDVAERVRRAAGQAGLSGTQRLQDADAVNFQQAFSQALSNVSKSQNQATALQREVAMDNPKVSIEETMVSMQKAQIGFQAALQVRNRLVQAYSDIMNMSV